METEKLLSTKTNADRLKKSIDQLNKWYDPEMELPEPSEPVLIKIEGYQNIKIGYHFKEHWYFEGGYVEVIGWMELPKWL